MRADTLYVFTICLLLVVSPPALSSGAYEIYESESDFETVLEGAKMAIQERGMYINNLMKIDEMLDRTGKDLGMTERIYEKAQSIEFCSAVLARKMTSEDPARIVNCPFSVSIYVLPGDSDKTYVAHRKLPQEETESSAVMAEVARMLEGVAEGAISW